MELQQLYLQDYKQTIQNAIINKKDCGLYAILPKNIIYRGKGQINEEYAQSHNFEIYNSIDFGGGIVGFKGDIVVIIIKQDGWDLPFCLLRLIRDFLQSKNINADIFDNDILVDGVYKVCSASSINVGDRYIYTGLQVSFNSDNDIISQICLKKSVKVPQGLAKYGVNNQEVFQLIKDFAKNL